MFFTTGLQLQAAISALPTSKIGGFTAFDAFYYGQQYMSAGKYSGTLSPIEHFVQIGAAQGNKPSAAFDPVYYASKYADLTGKGYDAADLLIHFLRTGLDEGRAPNATLAGFDGAAYLAANADVATYVNANLTQFGGSANNGALAHYVKFGQFDGHAAPTAAVAAATLTVNQDTLVGSAGNDTFKAMVVQNMYGSQTNQLATGDQINGGSGVDTLLATVQMANALGGGATQTIMPSTTSVEKAYFTALTVNNATDVAATETVIINAKLMTGLTSVGSVQSDASLTIQNLTTLTDNGVYADRRNTDSVTIRMDHTGNDKAVNAQSNLTVLFDNDYLVAGKTALSSVGYWVEDREAAKLTPATPLKKIDATGVVFTVNGSTAIEVKIPAASLATFLATDGTWAGYTALLQTALTLLKTGTPAVGTTPAVPADARLANLNFSLDTSNIRTLGKDATTLPVAVPAITLTSSVGDVLVAGGFVTKQEFGVTYDVFTEITGVTSLSTNLPVTSNIELLKAGRGAEGGNLTVGAMSTDLANTFNWSTTSALKQGVEVFNISVEGDATQFSSLASVQSTNNTLKTVNVVNKAGSLADLIIGNHNTANGTSALKDVQTFNAAGFANNLTLNAAVTTESIAKYVNLKDGAPALPAADNVAFVYTGGAGNDTINLQIDGGVSSSRSNILSGREDFSFTANGGAGNDTITLTLVNGQAGNAQAWYNNQKLNANVSVNGGDGNDTIKTPGAGDVKIDGGAGDDTIYTDNTGATLDAATGNTGGLTIASPRAVFVLNTANQLPVAGGYTLNANEERNLADLKSDVNDSTNLYKGKLTVTFKGLTSTVDIGNTVAYKTSDLDMNQAIKTAINSDPVLNKLLLATDGPANSLVVTSLIDGTLSNADLTVAVAAPAVGAISAADLVLVAAAYGMAVGTTEAQLLTQIGTNITAFNTKGDYVDQLAETGVNGTPANTEIAGVKSTSTSDNTITGGLGNDVIVLGTTVGITAGAVATQLDSSNDTVVYASGVFGNDVIVNFTADLAGGTIDIGTDVLNFVALGGNTAGFGAALTTDKSINVVTTITANNNATAVALLFNAANVAAQTHVYVAVDAATNIGTVYQVADAIGATNAVATLVGTIDLADTTWANLTAANFS